ncbi:ROK family protein [Paenibacillus sp. PAMC21692]|uniref:ROK family protein n=1 Tax=Paenibacillus sp. PAMC21692 TaxID=2762320 RepID=UPI00164EB415|nr:ROK family protein [Paenibacillus sp. PAMC21692]QNK60121.1 ROK family protein [Paenibacillus sp. PAMC21692]
MRERERTRNEDGGNDGTSAGDQTFTIGIDVGGTNIVCGAVDAAGRVIGKRKLPTEAHSGPDAVLDRIASMIEEIQAECGLRGAIAAVGIGVPGLIEPETGISRNAGNLGWRNIHVAAELEQRAGIAVRVDNDVKLYVYGEAVAGAGRGYRHVLGMTIGTGIASAAVSDGKLLYGHKAMAGEIGHVRMEGVDEVCACGLSGCLETFASASGMLRRARRLLEQGRPSVLRQWFPGPELARLTGADLSRAMDEGDELAREIIVSAGELTGRALAAAAAVLSPDIVIIGGGGALAGERLLSPLRRELLDRLLPEFREGLQVVAAEHNDDAGIIGSALYARERLLAK